MSNTLVRLLAMGVFLLYASPGAYAQQGEIAPGNEVRVALVIGNAAYKEAPLSNPVNDATDIAVALTDLGFKVILKRNANQREMRQAVREFGTELRRAQVGLFYYAGHGIQVRGNNYLVPVEADIQNEADAEDLAVDANYVLRTMEEAQIQVSIVIMDACRNNPFSRGFRSASRGLAQMSAATGSLVAFSTAPGSIAADGSGRNGTYTKHLLSSLQQADTDVLKVFQRVRAGVVRETGGRQVPWESTSLVGDFYFRPGGAATASLFPDRPSEPSIHPAGGSAMVQRQPSVEPPVQPRAESPVQVATASSTIQATRPPSLDQGTAAASAERRLVTYAEGHRYDGEFRNNEPNGQGTLIYPNGDRYQGQFVDGKRHGRGSMIFATGDRYEGEWRDDTITGRGIMTWPNGDRYEGQLVRGVRFGRGLMIYGDGGRYEGEWRDNYANGNGIMVWSNGQRYEGQWLNGNRHGYGVHDLAPGRRVQGEWRDDKPLTAAR